MAMQNREKVSDNWSFFQYKRRFRDDKEIGQRGINGHPMTWVPAMDHRRLSAYWLLDDVYRNSARQWLSEDIDPVDRDDRREYGEGYVIVEQFLASLLGQDQTLWVDGAVRGETTPAANQLKAMEEYLDKENFDLKMIECERNSVKLGDGVYTLGIDEKRKRPRINVYDPASYFPVLNDREQGAEDFPRKVHIAYEFEEGEGKDAKVYIRRITWQLFDENDDDRPADFPGRYTPSYGGAEATTENCYFMDAVWLKEDLTDTALDLSERTADWVTEPMWMNIDFIPVVHVPNTVALNAHFGTSVLAVVMQVLDDLISTDTDLQAASATTGTPPIVVGKARLKQGDDGGVTVAPGRVIEVGEGEATIMDTSRSLDALLKYVEHLLQRLSVNGRIPEALMGRVKPSEVPSGITLTLSFTPHSSVIRELRKVRKAKYRILLKFIWRLMQIADPAVPRDAFVTSEMRFGSFLPADKQEAVSNICQLYAAKVISLESAVNQLVEAGFTIDDTVLEIQRIVGRDYASAQELLNLTGDLQLVYETMGLQMSDAVKAQMEAEQENQLAMLDAQTEGFKNPEAAGQGGNGGDPLNPENL
jgi:hypothetical protein